jgi:Fibronectin type III domain
MFNRLKKPAQRAIWSRFKAQAEYLSQVDALGDTGAWLEGIAPAKVTDFAGEAAAQDIDTLSRYDPVKRLALAACLVHTARMQARDDLAEMLCKRVAANVKRAKAELEEIRLRQRTVSERLIGTYRTVLEHLDPGSEEARGRVPGEEEARAVAAIEQAGGFTAQLADIEEVSAFHGDNYEVLVARFFRKDRAVMFDLTGRLELVATTSDGSVLACLQHAREHWAQRRDFIPLPPVADGGEDGAGYVGDQTLRQVVRVAPGGSQTAIASGLLPAACCMAVDWAGNVYVADTANQQVVKAAPGGTQTTIALGFRPFSVAVDWAGTVYAADLDNNRVVKVTPGGTQTTVASGFSLVACDVAADWAGNAYVAVWPGQVVQVTLRPAALSSVPGSATITWAAPLSDGGAPITGYTVTAADSTNPANGGQTCTTSTSTATTCMVTGLTGGDSYTFTVTATNGAWTGPASTPSNPVIVTAPTDPP